ncbi:MAG: DUF1844 domain-containing protein [Myxococcota bacterium]|nr:DUF1844 domain-containing protein [Myxococcota bacterium]
MSNTPPVNFSQFIVSLASSALVHLGEIAEPGSTEPKVDLTLARHTIDLITMLQAKTAGNLDSEESRLVEAVLGDLRTKLLTASTGD